MPRGNGHLVEELPSATDEVTDFITTFVELTEGSFSPVIFRKWSGISLVGAALERRVWVQNGMRQTFPNLFIYLVAPPGVGKQVLLDTQQLVVDTNEMKDGQLFIAPNSMTRASLVDELESSGKIFFPPKGPPIEYHSMYTIAEEIGVLMPGYDMEFIAKLNSIFNNPSQAYVEKRRTGPVKSLSISLPQINLLAGVQPGWLASVFPDEAWSMGLASRLIMVYAADTPFREMFSEVGEASREHYSAMQALHRLMHLHGQMTWSDEAKERVKLWHRVGGPPVPGHSKLEHYNRRRTTLHAVKLIMISAVSRTFSLHIDLFDVERGIAWLLEAEALMPDIFRAMVGRSDKQVLDELHYYAMSVWRTNGQKPIAEWMLVRFLSHRVPSDKITKLLEVADRSNVLSRQGGTDGYIPRPVNEHGVE